MITELKKMLSGEMYDPGDKKLVQLRLNSRKFSRTFNSLAPEDKGSHSKLLNKWLGSVGERVEVEAPFICDYGVNTFLGSRVFINFNCVFLDCARVEIGDDVMIGPNVQIYTATHPLEAEERVRGLEYALPVLLGRKAWIGGGAIICPGVTIGENTTIGAGSVVVKDIPAGVFAVGNPCRVIRKI